MDNVEFVPIEPGETRSAPITEPLNDDWFVKFVIAEQGGSFVISELAVVPRKRGVVPERGITRDLLRSINVRQLQETARKFRNEYLEDSVATAAEHLAPRFGERSATTAVEPDAWPWAARDAVRAQGRRVSPETDLLAALAAYVYATAPNRKRNVTVADQLSTSKAGTSRLLSRARRLDYLPPTTQGKASPTLTAKGRRALLNADAGSLLAMHRKSLREVQKTLQRQQRR